MLEEMGKLSKDRMMEFIRFCLVGGATFVLDYGLLYICTEYAAIRYLYSSAISFVVAVVANYILCVKYVFREMGTGSAKRRQVLFIGSSVVGLGINQVCMYALVELLGMYYMVAKLVSTVVVTAWNYVMKRKAIAG